MSRNPAVRPVLARPTLLALAIGLAALTAGPALAGPPDVEVTAVGLDHRDLRKMGDPAVVDRAALQVQVDALAADLATFERMLDLVRDRRERKALSDQLTVATDRLAGLRTELRAAAPARAERGHRRDLRDVHRDAARAVEPAPVVEAPPQAATGAQLAALSESLRQASFRKDKMRVLRLAAPQNHFSTAQVKQLVEHFSFSSDKVEAIAMLHPRLVDPENTHTLFGLLPHASDRRKLEERITAPAQP